MSRFGTPPDSTHSHPPGSFTLAREQPNRILEFLTQAAKPTGDACRANRRRGSTARVELAWLENGQWHSVPGRLRDIGRGGAALLVKVFPPARSSARLRFVEGEGSPWIEAKVLAVEPEDDRQNRVRIQFEDACPSFLLHLAIIDDAETEVEDPGVRHEWPAYSTALED